MIAEFTIEFEVKSRKTGKYGDPEKTILEFDGTLTDGLKTLEEIRKKMGI
jgi:hypothetical protein